MVVCLDAAVMTTTGTLPAFDTMLGRETGATIRRYPTMASPLMNRSRSLGPPVREGNRLMSQHPYDGPEDTRLGMG